MPSYIEIHATDQASERLELANRLAFVTRGGFKVALPARNCPSELHLLEIEATPAGAQVNIPQGAPGSFALDGAMQRTAVVPWGGEVFWENLRVAFIQVAKPKERSPVVLLGLVGILLSSGFAVAGNSHRDVVTNEPEPPQIAMAPGACSASDAETSLRQAREAERSALARREQSAFVAADALAALRAFGEAKACYEKAGQAQDAARVDAFGRDWAAHLEADYAASRLQLQRALTQKRDAEALAAVKNLQQLLGGRSGPYVDWLAVLRVELEARIQRAGS